MSSVHDRDEVIDDIEPLRLVVVQVAEIRCGLVHPGSSRSFEALGLLLLHAPTMRTIPPCQAQDQKEHTLLPTSEDEGIVLLNVRKLVFLVAPFGLQAIPPPRHLVTNHWQSNRVPLGGSVTPFEVVLQDARLVL